MLGEDKLLRAIFSASNSEDLQQTLKYLKIFSERDYHMIRSYESNLKILSEKRKKLEKNVASLIRLKKGLEREEKRLLDDQMAKSKFLKHLSDSKKDSLKRLAKFRKQAGTDILDLSFFEKKGQLKRPFLGKLIQGFGMTEHPKYRYRLSHKGHLYKSKVARPVKAVASGRVAYSGLLEGFGPTTILDHGDHYYSVYSGLRNLKYKKGERVLAYDELSDSVNEIYFEIRHFSDAVDPKAWMKR
jgi:septal ring factor EnvC (AmiA/AmiB activator)